MVKTCPLKWLLLTSNWGIERSRLESPVVFLILLISLVLRYRTWPEKNGHQYLSGDLCPPTMPINTWRPNHIRHPKRRVITGTSPRFWFASILASQKNEIKKSLKKMTWKRIFSLDWATSIWGPHWRKSYPVKKSSIFQAAKKIELFWLLLPRGFFWSYSSLLG